MTEQSMFGRLEDFISLVREGKKVELTVTLDKQTVTRKFYPHITGESEDEFEMYILSAGYLFVVDGKMHEVMKFYASGIEGESPDSTKRNVYIANERLQMDYDRLRKAKIVFLEKFWDDQLRERY